MYVPSNACVTCWHFASHLDRLSKKHCCATAKYDVSVERSLDWLRPLTVSKQSTKPKLNKSAHSASGTSSVLSSGRTALLQQVIKLKQMYADSAGYVLRSHRPCPLRASDGALLVDKSNDTYFFFFFRPPSAAILYVSYRYSKTCPDCGRTFTHPPAWASHMGSRLCREESALAKQQQQQQNAKQSGHSRSMADSTAPPRGSPKPRAEPTEPDPRSWSAEEDRELLQLVRSQGATDWAARAAEFPFNRSASAIRKRWFKLQEQAADSMASARRREMQKEQQQRQTASTTSSMRRQLKQNQSFDQFSDPPEVGKAKSSNRAPPGWTKEEDAELRQLVAKHGVGNWGPVEAEFSSGRSSDAVRKRWHYVLADSGGDHEDIGTATSAKQSVPSAASKWSTDEDMELLRLVKEHGTDSSSWDPLSKIFCSKFEGSTRSGASLRGRWQRMEEEAAAVGTTVLDMRISLWHKTDKVVIKVRPRKLLLAVAEVVL